MPEDSTGRLSFRYRVSGSADVVVRRRRPGMAAAYSAAALAFTYAMVSLYWAAGGTALLSTVGGSVEDIGRQGGLPAVALGLAAAALKLAACILALALARPWGRAIPRAWLLAGATGTSAVLTCYGAIQVTAGSLVLTGAVRPAATVDWTALRWHVLVWDMWFLIWGILLATATVAAWRQSGYQEPAFEPGHTGTGPPAVASHSGRRHRVRVRARDARPLLIQAFGPRCRDTAAAGQGRSSHPVRALHRSATGTAHGLQMPRLRWESPGEAE